MRPKLLDLYCGAGGAARGYAEAGFVIVGIDIAPQPRYPYRFIEADAIVHCRRYGRGYDVIHASPPCKVHTSLKAFSGAHHVDLVALTRSALRSTGRPWVIENVIGAPLRDAILLCGSSFGLGVRRHRLFESPLPLVGRPCDHRGQAERSPGYPTRRYHSGRPVITMSPVIGVYGRGQGLGPGEVDGWRKAIGIDWMVREELREAIPPAYTRYLGEQIFTLMGISTQRRHR